jgi:hypothetical protein
MSTPNIDQLKRALVISEQIESLQKELGGILGNHSAPHSAQVAKAATAAPIKKKGMSAKARALIGAAQKLRWAKLKGTKAPAVSKAPAKTKPKMSAAGRANIVAAQKKRWAKINAGKKTSAPKAEAPVKKKRKPMSPATKAKMAAAMKARWAAAKAGKGPSPRFVSLNVSPLS